MIKNLKKPQVNLLKAEKALAALAATWAVVLSNKALAKDALPDLELDKKSESISAQILDLSAKISDLHS